MATSSKVGIGAVVLLLSTIALLAIGIPSGPVPGALAVPAVLGMALGSILVGTSVEGNPV